MNTILFRRGFLRHCAMYVSAILSSTAGAGSSRAAMGEAMSGNQRNDTLDTIRGLRTIHGNFTEQEIPDDLIETIIQSSIRAANASALQSYSIIVTRDRSKMTDICGYQGSCLLLYCVDYNRLKATAESLGHPYDPADMDSFITGSTNTILAAQTAVIAAKSLGIDSLLTNGVHRGDMNRFRSLVNLPDRLCYPLIALVLGYPTEEPEYLKGRLDGAGIIHQEKYHHIDRAETAEIVRKYDDKTLHIALRDDWGEMGYDHYLDLLHTEWMGRNATDEETQMTTFLKKSGFLGQS